jgi:hypothetical protein
MKKLESIKKLAKSLVFMLAVVTFAPTTANAATTTSLTYERVCKVPTYDECTNMGCMYIAGSTLYGFKTNSADTKSALYKVDLTSHSPKPVYVNTVAGLGHANGMAYHKDKNGTEAFFVARMEKNTTLPQVVKVDLNGNIKNQYNCTKQIKSITFYKGAQFIVGLGAQHYAFATISGKDLVLGTEFSVDKINEYVGQDIHYENGLLYIPTSDLSNGDNVTQNSILVVPINDTIKNGQKLPPLININATNSIDYKFEIESLDIYNGNGLMYFCTNGAPSSAPKSQLDCIYKAYYN